MSARSPRKRRRIGKAVHFEEELDSDNEEELPPTPPPKKKKEKRKGNYCTQTFEVGKPWQPGMFRNDWWDRKTIKAFSWAKRQYCEANPVWAKKDKIATIKKQLAKAEEPTE